MAEPREGDLGRAYGSLVRIMAATFVVIGAVIVVRTIEHGGGALSVGLAMGIVLIAIGLLRLRLLHRRPRG